MSTTKQAFAQLTAAQLVGATVAAAGAVVALNEENAIQIVNAGNGTRLDSASGNLATGGYAKNGAATLALVGTTPKTLTFADLTSATASSAGDTAFATINKLTIKNLGAGSASIAIGASNGLDLGLTGTTPALTLPAGATWVLEYPAGKTIDGTHKTLDITPAATTTLSFAVGGA